MLTEKKRKLIVQIVAVVGASGILLSGLSAAVFAPQPASVQAPAQNSNMIVETDANGNPVSGDATVETEIQIQTDADGNIISE